MSMDRDWAKEAETEQDQAEAWQDAGQYGRAFSAFASARSKWELADNYQKVADCLYRQAVIIHITKQGDPIKWLEFQIWEAEGDSAANRAYKAALARFKRGG